MYLPQLAEQGMVLQNWDLLILMFDVLHLKSHKVLMRQELKYLQLLVKS